jgi:hypothetical protein
VTAADFFTAGCTTTVNGPGFGHVARAINNAGQIVVDYFTGSVGPVATEVSEPAAKQVPLSVKLIVNPRVVLGFRFRELVRH